MERVIFVLFNFMHVMLYNMGSSDAVELQLDQTQNVLRIGYRNPSLLREEIQKRRAQ